MNKDKKIKTGFVEGAKEVKKKIKTDFKAAVMLIITEDIIALKNIIGTITKSASRSVRGKGGSTFPGNKEKA